MLCSNWKTNRMCKGARISRKTPVTLLIGLPVIVAGILLSTGCEKKATPAAMPPPAVKFVTVKQQDVPIYGDWVATLDGYVNAQIQPQVSGYLIKQDYREGSLVHKGQVLFEIDPRPFQAILDQAKGQLAQAKGQLAQAKAQLALSNINVKRDTPLAAAHAIAQSQLDNDLQSRAQNEALVQGGQAAIETSQAAIEQAQLNLGFTKVRSLIDGIAGIAMTQMGNLVSQTTVLTTVSQVNPIKAYFPISEQEYLLMAEKVKTDKPVDFLRQNSQVPLQLTLSNGNVFPQKGRIIFVDRQVDSQTGTIRIAGAFPNPGNVLRPGQFGRIRAMTGYQHGALLVPQKAVNELQGRYQIALLDSNNKVKVVTVTVGPRVGQDWIITKGVNAGDRVISEGVSKVRDGMPVNPTPDNSQTEGE